MQKRTPASWKKFHLFRRLVCWNLACLLWPGPMAAEKPEDLPAVPVPSSPFLPVVYRFADVMIERGRDTFGPEQSGMFLSALDRQTLTLLTNRPPAPSGVREGDRAGAPGAPLHGANPQHDANLLRLLETLSGLSGKPKYREAADAEIKWFLAHTGAPATGLLPWGEHLAWDVVRDQPVSSQQNSLNHEFFRPWLLWDRCFDLEPVKSRQFARALWDHQIADPQTGAFDRHAGYAKHAVSDGMDFARHAGFYIRTWAVAYDRTRDGEFLRAIAVLLGRYEKKRHANGWIELYKGQSIAAPVLTLSLAIDCDAAADRVPEPLATRLRAFAQREDELFTGLDHRVSERGGFVTQVELATASPGAARTALWEARYGNFTTAQAALMCVARYERSGRTAYRNLIVQAADAYLNSKPPTEVDIWAMTIGHTISLELAAWRHAARASYFDKARELGHFALERFWKDQPIPAASLLRDHYESVTGPDTLALALVELHLQILHITAVSAPANTADR